jgi:hypothetical protein
MGLIHYQPIDNIDLSQEEHSKPAVVPLQQRAKTVATPLFAPPTANRQGRTCAALDSKRAICNTTRRKVASPNAQSPLETKNAGQSRPMKSPGWSFSSQISGLALAIKAAVLRQRPLHLTVGDTKKF